MGILKFILSSVLTAMTTLFLGQPTASPTFCKVNQTLATNTLNMTWRDITVAFSKKPKYISVSDSDVDFYLFSQKPQTPILLLSNTTILQECVGKQFLIFIHGGGVDNATVNPWYRYVANSYLKTNPNLIIIGADWGKFSKNLQQSLAAVPGVGSAIAEKVWKLTKQNIDCLSNFHLIGHSVGAHVAGFAGKKIQNITQGSGLFQRITGMDPAGIFYCTTAPYRLDKTDAKYVDVHHTNDFEAGLADPIGHVDVYYNCGGPRQPCGKSLTCDAHQSVHQYFNQSINNPNVWPGYICNSLGRKSGGVWVYAGEHMDQRVTGFFCVYTDNMSYFTGVRINQCTALVTYL